MINMMKADLYRILRSKGIYIAFALLLFIIGISIYMIEPGSVGMSVHLNELSQVEEYNAMREELAKEVTPEEWQTMTSAESRELMLKVDNHGYKLDKDMLCSSMNLYYIFIFIAAIALTADFSGGSIKNTLSSAIDRRKYFFAKLGFITLGCAVMFFMNTYITYFANLILNGERFASSIAVVTKITIMQLPVVLALASILTGFGFLTKKTALYNTVTIPFIVVLQMLLGLVIKLFSIKADIMKYEFQTMFVRLANDPSNGYMLRSYIICAVVFVLFSLLGSLSFKKTEIK